MLRLLLPALSAIACAADAPRPNIVLIYADDLGWGDPACYRDGPAKAAGNIATPHLDALARDGMRFTDAHAAAAICSPSRLGLMTGRYPTRDGWTKGVLKPGDGCLINPALPTLPGVLKAAGYRTMLAGKWHVGETRPAPGAPASVGPLTIGFETFFERWLLPDGTAPDALTRFRDTDRRAYEACAAWLAERAADRTPFFLQFCPKRPHDPYVHEAGWQRRSGVGDYGDAVMQLDAHIGLLLSDLDRLGLAQRTLVIVTSDNGPESSPHDYSQPAYGVPEDTDDRIRTVERSKRFGHDSAGGWRGHKYQAYEGGHRMPFLVRWPGVVPAGTVNDRLICQTDLLATCAALAGAPRPTRGADDSFDVSPLLRDAQAPAVRRGGIFASGNAEPRCIRRDRWTLITGKTTELYDLAADPAQQTDLAAKQPKMVAELRAWAERVERDGGEARARP